MNRFTIPVVLLIYNRPRFTKVVLNKIKLIKPSVLMVVGDGPVQNDENDARLVQETRNLLSEIDWNCEVMSDLSEVNLGLKKRVSSGLDWVFSNVDSAIILEDDCDPHPSFFTFCEELLAKYKDDERIFNISGNNFLSGNVNILESYYFSIFNHCWGWATWKRAWNNFDYGMKDWPAIKENQTLKPLFSTSRGYYFWEQILEETYLNLNSSWAYRWAYTCFLNNGLTILPATNLVSNIGFGSHGTNTTSTHHPLANLPAKEIEFPLRDPQKIKRNIVADAYTESHYFSLNWTAYFGGRIKEVWNNIF